MKKADRLEIRIEPELKKMAQEKASKFEIALSKVVRDLLEEWTKADAAMLRLIEALRNSKEGNDG